MCERLEHDDGTTTEILKWKDRALAAEARAERLARVLTQLDQRTGHFGEPPEPPEWMPMLSLIAWVGRTSHAALAANREGIVRAATGEGKEDGRG